MHGLLSIQGTGRFRHTRALTPPTTGISRGLILLSNEKARRSGPFHSYDCYCPWQHGCASLTRATLAAGLYPPDWADATRTANVPFDD